MATRVRTTRRGLRLEQHGCVLSEILVKPGATESVFDVLAAAVHCFSPGPRVAMLGFAGGGMVAPLRKLGGTHALHGVDLESEGYRLYRSVAAEWGGEVVFAKEDALAWLRRERRRFDAIVEDLSMPQEGDVVKPEVSWEALPKLMARRLRGGGVVITNLLPTPGMSWASLIAACRVGPGVVVGLAHYHNRVLIQGSQVGGARRAGARMREALQEIGSGMAKGLTVRQLGP